MKQLDDSNLGRLDTWHSWLETFGYYKATGKQKNLLTLETVNAGLHCSFKISRQMLPLLLIFG